MRGFSSFGVPIMVFGLLLLLLAEQSMQLSLQQKKHPTYAAIQRVGLNAGPYLGLVLTSSSAENALESSGLFNSSHSFHMFGRKFNIGKIKDADVVYLNARGDIANVVLSVQLLLNIFNIRGIIQFGVAGSVANGTLNIGDVVVPESFVFSGNWEWRKYESKKGKLKFGDYNQPEKGDNLLGSVNFQKSVIYSGEDSSEKLLWLPSNPTWLQLASELADLELDGETDSTRPKVVFGLKGSSADIYFKNVAIAEFLNKRLNISTVDTTSAATTLVSLTNAVPSIVFAAISNTVIGEGTPDSAAATVNALKTAAKFIDLLTTSSSVIATN